MSRLDAPITKQDLAEFREHPKSALRFLDPECDVDARYQELGERRIAAATELAAWTMTANLLLNLDEVVTKN